MYCPSIFFFLLPLIFQTSLVFLGHLGKDDLISGFLSLSLYPFSPVSLFVLWSFHVLSIKTIKNTLKNNYYEIPSSFESGLGLSADCSPGVPSTSGADSELTSVEEIARLLNCTDHYSVLGLSRYENVDVSVLKREYRKMVMGLFVSSHAS